MNRLFLLLMLVCSPILAARAKASLPVIRLMPSDIVQDSIKQVHWTTNTFVVKWKYTRPGAKRMLDFWMQHSGQKVCIVVGSFTTPPFTAPGPLNPLDGSHWKKRWLEIRTDEFVNLNQETAKTIVAALKGG
ncbi:MAG: hypothetical protein KGJ88_14075 [Verrucomicrobiota bacterium]|nr:hypothetical protein [Verrucomicrobiota bacterium]